MGFPYLEATQYSGLIFDVLCISGSPETQHTLPVTFALPAEMASLCLRPVVFTL